MIRAPKPVAPKRQRDNDTVVMTKMPSCQTCSLESPCPIQACMAKLLPQSSVDGPIRSRPLINGRAVASVACGEPIMSSYACQMHLYDTADIAKSHGCALVGCILTDAPTMRHAMRPQSDEALQVPHSLEVESKQSVLAEEVMQLLRLSNSKNKSLILMTTEGPDATGIILDYKEKL